MAAPIVSITRRDTGFTSFERNDGIKCINDFVVWRCCGYFDVALRHATADVPSNVALTAKNSPAGSAMAAWAQSDKMHLTSPRPRSESMIERGLLGGAPLRGIIAVGVMLAVVGDPRAQDCKSLSGPARTDCFIARARMFGQQSDVAAGEARRLADKEFLRAATGMHGASPPHRARPKHKAAPP